MCGFTLETDIGLGFEIWLEVRNLLHWRGQGALLVTTLLGGAKVLHMVVAAESVLVFMCQWQQQCSREHNGAGC